VVLVFPAFNLVVHAYFRNALFDSFFYVYLSSGRRGIGIALCLFFDPCVVLRRAMKRIPTSIGHRPRPVLCDQRIAMWATIHESARKRLGTHCMRTTRPFSAPSLTASWRVDMLVT
jgi:hypothetical protein